MRRRSRLLSTVALGLHLLVPAAASAADAEALPRVFAVVVPGPGADGLDSIGVLDALLLAGDTPWVGAEALIIPGAAGHALGRRLHRSRIDTTIDAPDLLHQAGFTLLGAWGRVVDDPAVDLAAFAQARRSSGAGTGVVLHLGCSLGNDACNAVARQAIAELAGAAADGDLAVFLSVPPSGAPARGALWVAGRDVDPYAPVRFRLIDFAPMLLYLTGHPLPSKIDGSPVIEVLRKDVRFRRPPRFVGGRP